MGPTAHQTLASTYNLSFHTVMFTKIKLTITRKKDGVNHFRLKLKTHKKKNYWRFFCNRSLKTSSKCILFWHVIANYHPHKDSVRALLVLTGTAGIWWLHSIIAPLLRRIDGVKNKWSWICNQQHDVRQVLWLCWFFCS